MTPHEKTSLHAARATRRHCTTTMQSRRHPSRPMPHRWAPHQHNVSARCAIPRHLPPRREETDPRRHQRRSSFAWQRLMVEAGERGWRRRKVGWRARVALEDACGSGSGEKPSFDRIHVQFFPGDLDVEAARKMDAERDRRIWDRVLAPEATIDNGTWPKWDAPALDRSSPSKPAMLAPAHGRRGTRLPWPVSTRLMPPMPHIGPASPACCGRN